MSPAEPATHRLHRAIALAIAGALLINGLVMVADPNWWFFTLPGIDRTGPFNPHITVDLGILYLVLGAAMALAALGKARKPEIYGLSAAWLSGHAVLHLSEGHFDAGLGLAVDLGGVYLPAILTGYLFVVSLIGKNPSGSELS